MSAPRPHAWRSPNELTCRRGRSCEYRRYMIDVPAMVCAACRLCDRDAPDSCKARGPAAGGPPEPDALGGEAGSGSPPSAPAQQDSVSQPDEASVASLGKAGVGHGAGPSTGHATAVGTAVPVGRTRMAGPSSGTNGVHLGPRSVSTTRGSSSTEPGWGPHRWRRAPPFHGGGCRFESDLPLHRRGGSAGRNRDGRRGGRGSHPPGEPLRLDTVRRPHEPVGRTGTDRGADGARSNAVRSARAGAGLSTVEGWGAGSSLGRGGGGMSVRRLPDRPEDLYGLPTPTSPFVVGVGDTPTDPWELLRRVVEDARTYMGHPTGVRFISSALVEEIEHELGRQA